jgi:hypothetical protein
MLAELAYERELSLELTKLASDFDAWRAKEVTCWDLSDRIHEFHDGASRELYAIYNRLKPEFTVGRAVVRGLLLDDDVPPEVRPEIESSIEFARGFESDDPQPAS